MPAVGVANFIGERLSQLRKARGITSGNLADMVGISQPAISQYEKGTHLPKQEIVDSLANVLNVPVGFFSKPLRNRKQSNLFYRSMSATTKSSRITSEAKYEIALDLFDYLLGFFDFPEINLPSLDIPSDFKDLDAFKIETYANQLREHWNLGFGPISNVVRTLESNGIIVWRTRLEAETQDAFSEFRIPHPIVVLSTEKNNYFRSRFDAAHELGHLILHKAVNRNSLNSAKDFRVIEDQAHLFASSFLTPSSTYSKDLWDVSLDAFRSLKPRWNVSIAMQIVRCRELGLIDEQEEKRLWINLSRRKWRKNEPLDDIIDTEAPSLIANSIKMLIAEGAKTKDQLVQDLQLNSIEIEKIIEKPGILDSLPQSTKPRFKKVGENVIQIDRFSDS